MNIFTIAQYNNLMVNEKHSPVLNYFVFQPPKKTFSVYSAASDTEV